MTRFIRKTLPLVNKMHFINYIRPVVISVFLKVYMLIPLLAKGENMKTLLISLVFCCFFLNAFSQLSGKLVSENGQPIPAANILLLKRADSSLVKATLTDRSGNWQMENPGKGNFIIRCSSVGYQSWDSPEFELTDTATKKDFNNLIMNQESKQLGEVVVRATKPLFQQQPEGMVVNVESSVLTKGSSALEVLERSPGVIIDHQNNAIALNGKNGVMVMINGKLLRMPIQQVVSLLNGMSADNIGKIELLTTPPAKYDAEGSAGMINIVMKKSKKKGTNGSVSATAGYGWREKETASVNLDHNTGKIDINGSYTFTHDRNFSDWHSLGTNNMPVLGGQNYTDFLSNIYAASNNHNATLGIEAKLTPSITVGGNVNYIHSDVDVNTINYATYNVVPDKLYTLNAHVDGVNHWNNWISSGYAEKKLGNGEQIGFDLDYLNYHNNNPYNSVSSFLDQNGKPAGINDTLFSPYQNGYAKSFIKVGVAKIDYSKQFSQRMKLEAGIKGTYTRDSSSSGINSQVNDIWVNRPESTSDIIMKEYIGAAYASLNDQINPATSLTIGLRYEYSHTRMVNPVKDQLITERKLGGLFPDIFFTRKLNEHSELQFSYTKRITRPTYNDLASFVTYTSPNSVESGNPLLRPTITNNVKIGYYYLGYSFSVLLSRDDYPIAGYQLSVSPQGDLIDLRPENLVYQHNLTFQINLPFKVNNWWNMNVGFVGGWRHFKLDYTTEPAEKTYFGYSANFSESFKIPRNFNLEISGWYNGLSYNGTKRVEGFGTINAGIKKELKNNGGAFQLTMQDIFRTLHVISYYGTLTEEAFNLKSRVVYSGESAKNQIIKLTYTRSFGNDGTKSQRNQHAGSQEERERVRN